MTTYSWVGPSSYTSSDQSPLLSPAVAGIYTLTVTDSSGCTDTEEAIESLQDLIQMADVIVPGHDNLLLTPRQQWL